jgi:proline racemase
MDIAYGGNFYAILPARAAGLEIVPENASGLIEKGRRIKDAVNSQMTIIHPEKEFMNYCQFVEFYGEPTTPGAHAKNAAFFPENGLDRSPCGTGTSAKLATLYAKGKLKLNEEFVHESIIGSIFRARAVAETRVGPFPAIIPEVTGRAHVMAMNQFFIDPDDPHRHGFMLI